MTLIDRLYAPFKIKESDFSQKALNRLKVLGFLAIPSPIALYYVFHKMDIIIKNPVLMITFFIPLIAVLYCLLQRPINYLTRMDKNLDEWEQGLKHRSESFAFRIFVFPSLILATLGLVPMNLMPEFQIKISAMALPEILIGFVIAAYVVVTNYIAWTVTPIPEDQEGFESVNEASNTSIMQVFIGIIAVFVIVYVFGYWVGYLSV